MFMLVCHFSCKDLKREVSFILVSNQNMKTLLQKKTAGDGESEERVLTLSKEEQRELEIQFAGLVICFNCITVDI